MIYSLLKEKLVRIINKQVDEFDRKANSTSATIDDINKGLSISNEVFSHNKSDQKIDQIKNIFQTFSINQNKDSKHLYLTLISKEFIKDYRSRANSETAVKKIKYISESKDCDLLQQKFNDKLYDEEIIEKAFPKKQNILKSRGIENDPHARNEFELEIQNMEVII